MDGLYLQLIDRGIVEVGEYETDQHLFKAGNLVVTTPPPENVIASKLVRCSEKDVEDCLFLAKKKRVGPVQIEQTINSMQSGDAKKQATENLTLLKVILAPYNAQPEINDDNSGMEP